MEKKMEQLITENKLIRLIDESIHEALNEVRYIDTRFEQPDGGVHKSLDNWSEYNQEPIKNNERIRVFHGTNLRTAVEIAIKGVSGKEWRPRTYSYEQGMNPVGLFVTTDFVKAKYFASPFNGGDNHKAAVIIEFTANSNDLDTPVWNNSNTFFGQGSNPMSFGSREERDKQKQAYNDEARKSKYDYISKSDNPAMADNIFNNSEHQALFIGDLNPNMIKRFWVKKYKHENGYVATEKQYTPMSRQQFLKIYGNDNYQLRDGDSYRGQFKNEKAYLPNEDFTTIEDFALRILRREERLYPKMVQKRKANPNYSEQQEIQDNIDGIKDCIKYGNMDTLLSYMWPKQFKQFMGKEQYDKYDRYGIGFPNER
jgi:hypothetical protein